MGGVEERPKTGKKWGGEDKRQKQSKRREIPIYRFTGLVLVRFYPFFNTAGILPSIMHLPV